MKALVRTSRVRRTRAPMASVLSFTEGREDRQEGSRGRGLRHTRRGFSLAELMIAIGILGVGMLMVAATFPVGIQQSRVATDDTVSTVIRAEATAMLDRLLLQDGRNLQVADVTTSTIHYNLGNLLHASVTAPTKPPALPLGMVLATPAPADPSLPANWFDLNRWLRGEAQDKQYAQVPPLSPAVSLYPSGTVGAAAPRYSWAVYYTATGMTEPRQFHFTLLVRRGGGGDLVPFPVSPVPLKPVVVAQSMGSFSGAQMAAKLAVNTTMFGDNGAQYRIQAITMIPATNQGQIQLDRTPPTNTAVLYAFARDTNTGAATEIARFDLPPRDLFAQ